MPRIGHGEVATFEQLQAAEQELASQAASVELGFAVAAAAGLQDFDYLFLDLQDDEANLLPKSAAPAEGRPKGADAPIKRSREATTRRGLSPVGGQQHR